MESYCRPTYHKTHSLSLQTLWTVILTFCLIQNAHALWENVAVNKSCNMSSIHNFVNTCKTAINNNTNTVYNWTTPGNCIHTALNDTHPRWTVDLGQLYTISQITIFARDDNNQIQRMTAVNLSIGQRHVYQFPDSKNNIQTRTIICPSSVGPTQSTGCDVNSPLMPATGRTVTLARQEKPNDKSLGVFLNVCEVQVWVCLDGYYGVDCSNTCGVGCQHCDKLNGTCTCKSGWVPPLCQECTKDYYRSEGRCLPCSEGCVRGSCGQYDGGNCTCRAGWTTSTCGEMCRDGQYGINCSNSCGAGCLNYCDKENGTCTCKTGWKTPLCTMCGPGHYGPTTDCTACGTGCIDTCDDVTGNCTCKTDRWVSPLCSDCQTALWGTNCSQTCGQCGGDKSCHVTTGHCMSGGCLSGWQGEQCLQTAENPISVAAAVGAGVGAAVLIAVIVVVVVIVVRRRKKSTGRKSTDKRQTGDRQSLNRRQEQGSFCKAVSGTHSLNSARHSEESKPTAVISPQVKQQDIGSLAADQHIYGNVSPAERVGASSPGYLPSLPVSEVRTRDSPTNRQATQQNEQSTRPPIAARPLLLGPVYENVRVEDNSASNPEPLATESERFEEDGVEEDSSYNNENLYACYKSISISESVLDSFQKYLLECLASPAKLTEEFTKFPKGMPHPHDVGSDACNSKKNRFKKLCAYDKNRVILHRPKGDTDTDYINASYIKGYRGEKTFIATQGPLASTVPDLWWMVWQEDVRQIIMLTNLQEDGKNKCDKYWPAVGKTVTYGHVTVTSYEEKERADFIVRTFALTLKGNSEQRREVQQYHYITWPDHGVPVAGDLVNFWRYVTTRATRTALPIVHCSAGVGRTGTYIALDNAINRKSRDCDVSVQDIVSKLRDQRSIMVQTEVQYKFLHEVILEAYTSRDTRMTFNQLDSRFPEDVDVNKVNEVISKEFKLLIEMKQWAKPDHTTAELEKNRAKNRDPNVLPDERHMVYLTVYIRGRNQYINAVTLSSFTMKNGLLLTQLPLPTTVVDLWRLVEGFDVSAIVSLGSKQEDKVVKDFCHYWPRMTTETQTFGPYTLALDSAKTHSPHVQSYVVTVKKKDYTHQLKIIHYTDWSGDTPGDTADLLRLMNTLKADKEDDTSPVIIQCLEGATRSGLFCVLYDVMNRMTQDEEVDVFSTVRNMHTVRPQAVKSETQYRYCYRFAQEVKRNINVYINA